MLLGLLKKPRNRPTSHVLGRRAADNKFNVKIVPATFTLNLLSAEFIHDS